MDPDTPTPAETLAIAVGVADLRSAPASDSELVTQALLNTPATVLERSADWARIQTPDYTGWVRHIALATPPTPSAEQLAVVLAPRAPIFATADGDETIAPAYITTALPVREQSAARIQVALPGTRTGWLDTTTAALRPAEAPYPRIGPPAVLVLAQQFLGIPYLWGGTTIEGIDCSGFSQLCWRAAGAHIPRDANQQYDAIPYQVGRGELQSGDLIFFAHEGSITHVAIMLDTSRYIHAKGRPQRQVIISSLDPSDHLYLPALAAAYAGARRPMTDATPVTWDGDPTG
ncbi:MAG: hypothetical protein OJF49_002718 [Ktedonobacterales bacterium]|nr:MAG: hypothetical protein OJF49_002718 [Ktedonobacterales bacterium]